MRYKFEEFLNKKDFVYGEYSTQLSILENIKRQKRKINNSKKYSDEEKKLIMKGIDMAFDRAWAYQKERWYKSR
jgi:cyclophilin family peptidyl-prolyl cis-trans isomerase